jgi:hypothetical protein
MANKVLEMAIAIKGKLDGGLSSSVSKASQELNKLSNAIKDQQAQYRKLQAISQKTGNVSDRNAAIAAEQKLNSMLQRQAQLRSNIASQTAHQNAISKMGGASPLAGTASAAQGASAAVSGITGKLASFAMVAAGGFGIGAIIDNVVNAGEALYQLSNKLHMTTAETAQFKKIMTLSGVDVEAAAKSFAKMDKTLAGGGKSAEALQGYLSQFGVSLTDANGKLLPMNQQLDAMAKGYQNAVAQGRGQEFMLETLGAKGMKLTKVFENYADAQAAASQIKGVGIDPKSLHKIWLQMNILKAEATQVALGLAQAFIPIAQQILPALIPVLQAVVTFMKDNKEAIAAVVTNGLKLALLYGTATKLASGITTITTAFKGVETAMGAFKAAGALIGGPWVIAIMAIITVIYLLVTNWDTICATLTSVWDSVCSTLSSAWSAIISGIMAVINGFLSLGLSVFNALKAAIIAYVNLWLNLPTYIGMAVGFIIGIILRLPEIAVQVGTAVISAVVSFATECYNFAVTTFSAMVDDIYNFLINLPMYMITLGAEFVAAVISFASEAYATATSWISSLVNDVINFIMNLPSACADAGAGFVAAAGQWASDAYNAVLDWIKQIPSAVSNAIAGAWDSIKAQFSGGFTVGVQAAGGNAYANGGVITSPEVALIGEAGYPEVIVPIDGSANAMNLWQTAGRMLGVSGAQSAVAPTVSLAPSVPVTSSSSNSGAHVQITFAPVINAGNGSTDDIMSALDAKMREFEQMMRSYTAGQRRLSYD